MTEQRFLELELAVPNVKLDWITVENCEQARSALSGNPDVALVVCDQTLPDGSWYCILDWLTRRDLKANLLVVEPVGCDASVVESHGLGILRHPFDEATAEVIAKAASVALAPQSLAATDA